MTSKGDVEIELWCKECPRACRNFIGLGMEGYYDGTIFHRVVPGTRAPTRNQRGSSGLNSDCWLSDQIKHHQGLRGLWRLKAMLPSTYALSEMWGRSSFHLTRVLIPCSTLNRLHHSGWRSHGHRARRRVHLRQDFQGMAD